MNSSTQNPSATGKSAHTPGPWRVVTRQILGSCDCEPVIVCADPHPDFDDVARVLVPDSQRDGGRDGATALANARLIAAAPELLAALKRVFEIALVAGDDLSNAAFYASEQEMICAAIAKAQGGAE